MPDPTITKLLPLHRGDPFCLVAGGQYLQHPALTACPWLVHGFSLRDSVSRDQPLLGASSFEQSGEDVKPLPNQNDFVASLTGKAMILVRLRQRHSDAVVCLDRFAPGNPAAVGDALITRRSGLLLAVQVADCLPVIIVDKAKRILAAVHAGWRGILAGVVPKTLEALQSRYACDPLHCLAVIGPSIGPCCYEVGPDVATPFEDAFPGRPELWRDPQPLGRARSSGTIPSADPPGSRRMLDLSAACRCQLETAGLPDKNIFSRPPCTACHPNVLYSYRADRGSTGRMLAVIGKIR